MKIIVVDKKIYKKISDMTSTDYEAKEINEWEVEITQEEVISIFEDLISEVEEAVEKVKDIETDLEENYRLIPISEQVGISDRDFI